MTIPFVTPRARFFDANGNPLASGTVSFYDAGTSTLKTVYSDYTTGTPADNPHTLDAAGQVQDGGVWLGDGPYKIVLKNSAGVEQWTVDYVPGATGSTSLIVSANVGTIAALRGLDTNTYTLAFVQGYFQAGDMGGGWFAYFPASSETDDGGAWIAPNAGGGRWKRIFAGEYLAAHWGAVSTATSVVDSALSNALTYCAAQGVQLTIQAGELAFGVSTTYSQQADLVISEGASVSAASAITLDLNVARVIVQGLPSFADANSNVVLGINTTFDSQYPIELWGAVGDGSTNCYDAFANAVVGGIGGGQLLLTRDYYIAPEVGAPTLTLPSLHFLVGSSFVAVAGQFQDISVSAYTYEDGCGLLFSLPFSAVLGLPSRVAAHHFDASWTGADYASLIDLVTQTGAISGTIDVLDDYSIATMAAAVPTDYTKITHVFGGGVITYATTVYLGYIDAPAVHILTASANGRIYAICGAVPLAWWGFTEAALGAALNSWLSIDGMGKAVSVAGAVSFDSGISAPENLEYSNFYLSGAGSLSIASVFKVANCLFILSGGVSFEGLRRLTGCEFRATQLSLVDPIRCVITGNIWTDSGTPAASPIAIAGSGSHVVAGLSIRDNVFYSANPVAIDTVSVSGCAASGHNAEVFSNYVDGYDESTTRLTKFLGDTTGGTFPMDQTPILPYQATYSTATQILAAVNSTTFSANVSAVSVGAETVTIAVIGGGTAVGVTYQIDISTLR